MIENLFALALVVIGVIELVWPQSMIRVWSSFGRVNALDPFARLIASAWGPYVIRVLGASFVVLGLAAWQ
jgi:hypothetical protein